MKISSRSVIITLSFAILFLLLPGTFFGIFINSKAATEISVTTSIPVGKNPNFMAYDSADNKMFVVGTGSVTVINAATNVVLATIKVTKPNDIIYNPTNDEIYVVSENLHVVAISGSTDEIVKSISVQVDDFYQDLAYNPANGNVYVADTNSGEVSVISSSTNSVISTIKTGADPQHLLFDPANNEMYVSVSTKTTGAHPKTPYVDVISSSTNLVIATIILTDTAGSYPDAFFAYNPANQEMYLSDKSGNVYVLSSSTNSIVTTISLTVFEMAYDSADQEMYATTVGSGVSIISNSNTVVSTVGDTFANGYIVFNPTDSDIFVSGSSTYVISGSTLVTSTSTANAGFIAYNLAGSDVYISITESPGFVDVISS